MTRRERLEAKLEKRAAWAAGRRQKAAPLLAAADPYRGDVAFNTQPGHIPERARVIRRVDKGLEHTAMADHHDAKAAGLERQLDRAIFSDDENAIEALQTRIDAREAKRARMVETNKLFRKGDAAGLAALGLNLETLRAAVAGSGVMSWHKIPHPAYELSNLGGLIRADRERIKAIQARQQRTDQAEAAPGGVLIDDRGPGSGVTVTFAEKPARAILDALRAAGFWWRGGHWIGLSDKLPAEVRAQAAEASAPPATPAECDTVPAPGGGPMETKRPPSDRDEAITAIRAALRRRSGKSWSVTGGRGTSWGWIRVGYPPARCRFTEDGTAAAPGERGGYPSPEDRQELGRLLGLEGPAHVQGESIPAGSDYRREYLDRAEGRAPSVLGAAVLGLGGGAPC